MTLAVFGGVCVQSAGPSAIFSLGTTQLGSKGDRGWIL